VQQAFGTVPQLSLAVEHGFHYQIKNGPWQQLLPGLQTSWRDVAEAIIKVYTTRTNGSFMQKKGASISWNYQHADPEFGAMQARELQYHLQGVLTAFPVHIRVGKGYVEACPKGINKGVMAERAIDIAAQHQATDAHGFATPLEFVLCMGDDSSDELMFQSLHAKLGHQPENTHLFTCTVGRKPSEAKAYLGDHTEVVELLKMLSSIGASRRMGGYSSMGDLIKLDSEHQSPVGRRGSMGIGGSSQSLATLPSKSATIGGFGGGGGGSGLESHSLLAGQMGGSRTRPRMGSV